MAQTGARVSLKCVNLYEKLNTFVTKVLNRDVFDMVYPVGAIYMSTNDVDPSTLFGGTWERIQNRFLLAKGSNFETLGATGGATTVSLTQSQMPRHTHTQNSHSHKPSNTDSSFVTKENTTGARNRRVTTVSSGSDYVDTATGSYFHNYASTNSVTATNKYTGGTNTTEATQNGSAHENMPPYIVVNVWKRTA